MRSDEEIEGVLEDWLDAEAVPIPRNVLEAALESISRTAQVRSRRPLLAWQSNRPMGMVVAVALLVLIAVTGGLALDRFGFLFLSGAGKGPLQVWDPVADWRSAPNEGNPSPDRYGNAGVWRYMRSTSAGHDPGAYILMPNFEADLPGFLGEGWNEPSMINVLVARLLSDASIYLHPTQGVHAILAWKSPVAGQVDIEGVVARPQNPCDAPSHGLLFSVDRGAETLRTISLDNGQEADFILNTIVGVGDRVYFVVDADGDANCDLTQLRVTVKLSP